MSKDASLPDEVACVLKPGSLEEVDEVGYSAANPDVARLGLTARAHFQSQGHAEGRMQWANLAMVSELRKQKLARLRWAGPPPDVADGKAVSFLSPEIIESFGIPEDVPVSAHQYGPPLLELIQQNRHKLFLDVGAGLRHIYYGNVVNTDIYPSVCTDVMCVGEDLPFADELFDHVFCFAVLEHTMRPWDVAREMCRVLKPGGTILVDWPFLQPVHGYPHHYFNATPTGNRSLFEPYCDIESVEVSWHHHPLIAAQWILTAWRNGLPADTAELFQAMSLGTMIDDALETQLERDYCLNLHPEMKRVIASGSLMTGVRRPMAVPSSGPGQASQPTHSATRHAGSQQANDHAREIASLRHEIALLRGSTSWRITSPLRALSRGLRRGKT
jgi:SAM-dependent methyltransferase